MPISAEQITHRNILRVLLMGFTLVILMLLAAGFVSVRNIRSIQANAATLVAEQDETSDLIEQVQREQGALRDVFYKIARDPESLDRDKMLAQLSAIDENMGEIMSATEGTPEEAAGRELKQASQAFIVEVRRILALENPPTRLSADLLRRHQQVSTIVTQLIAANQKRAQAAQQVIDQQSRKLMTQSFVLLGASLLLALLFAVATVRMTTDLFRRMEWQTSELSRVSWHMLETQETTARRFSHELHDELGQSLTALKANLASLRRPDVPSQRLDDCLQLVDDSLRNVRELAQLLHPTILDDFGLDAGLRWLSERFMQRTGIDVDYTSTFSKRLGDEKETHLFRIAQEALTNVARHSGATRVGIRLSGDQNEVRLGISDNGSGLRNGGPAGEGGMGMIGMRARARSAGGELILESSGGQGLRIEVRVPVRGGERAKEHRESEGREQAPQPG